MDIESMFPGLLDDLFITRSTPQRFLSFKNSGLFIIVSAAIYDLLSCNIIRATS